MPLLLCRCRASQACHGSGGTRAVGCGYGEQQRTRFRCGDCCMPALCSLVFVLSSPCFASSSWVYFLQLLCDSVCVCLCRGGTRATQGNTKGEHTRTRPVYRCVVCCMPAMCSLRLFVFVSRWLLCSCLCRLNSQESRIQMS